LKGCKFYIVFYIGITFRAQQLDSVVQLVRAPHLRAAGSILARGSVVRSNKCVKFTLEISIDLQKNGKTAIAHGKLAQMYIMKAVGITFLKSLLQDTIY
jgi:hypothetical protein